MLILNVLIVCNIFSKSIYKDEVQSSVDNSIELAMSLLSQDSMVRLTDTDANFSQNTMVNIDTSNLNDLQKNFINILSKNINSKITDLEVNFYAADDDAKLLSVEVIANFRYLDGHIGTVSSYKTMIVDKNI